MKAMRPFVSLRMNAVALGCAVGIAWQASTFATQQTPTTPAGKGKIAAVGRKKALAGAAVGGVPASGGANQVGLLDQAYGLLRTADHDYHGHRARAMHQIEDAVKELGAHVSGSGKGHQKQVESDSQVKSAQSLLQEAVGGLMGRPHRHIEEAIKQLVIALTVK